MSDFLRTVAMNPLARRIVKAAHIPIPLPPILSRAEGPWAHEELQDRQVVLFEAGLQPSSNSSLSASGSLCASLVRAGAVISKGGLLGDHLEDCGYRGLVFDARKLKTVSEMRELYEVFHNQVRSLAGGARIVLLAKIPISESSPEAVAVQESLIGFTKSLAKELGSKGIGVNILQVNDGASIDGALRFFLGSRSSYITGQVITIGLAGAENQTYTAILRDRHIVITGAARGIGAEIARVAYREGAKLLLIDHPNSSVELDSIAAETKAETFCVDLNSPIMEERLLKELWSHAPLHGFVHNAGITRDKTIARMDQSQWDMVQRINFQVPISITEALLAVEQRDLVARDASFVFLSSIGGIAGNAGQTNYAASKAGLIGYVKGLSVRGLLNGDAQNRQRFNAVAPGFIETKMTEAMPFAMREVARRLNSFRQGGLPIDVAEAVVYLMSTAGSEISGQSLRVCGQNLIGA